MGVSDPTKIFTQEDMAKGDVLFAATGVTDGNMLAGVRFAPDMVTTETLVMRSWHGTIRWIKAKHTNHEKFVERAA